MSVETIVIVGGGISGITTAVEAAEVGYNVILVEKNAYLGGRVAQLNKYFPKLCPPYCGLEMNFRRIKLNPKITVYTLTEVENVSGKEGDYSIKLKVNPRYVNEKCTACNACAEVCPAERSNDFNFGMNKSKAIYLPHELAYPTKYVIDRKACAQSCDKCVKACVYNAIDLTMKSETVEVKAGSIVYATGWNPYDATKMQNLGFGRVKNVITNMMMERLAAPNGPTGGKIVRPSDGREVKKVVFVQCAGSRDQNHLNYCSAICCMASLKQATYIRDRYPDADIMIAYIDLRTSGKYEAFLNKVENDKRIRLVKGKVAQIEEDRATGNVILTSEDVEGGGKSTYEADMVVLATGMAPSVSDHPMLAFEQNGFIQGGKAAGIYSTGVAKRPSDVTTSLQDATGVALKSIQSLVRS
jgi:quinone-modifying oxidoreductase subunit QmoA